MSVCWLLIVEQVKISLKKILNQIVISNSHEDLWRGRAWPGEAPEHKAQATVGVQAQRHVARGVQHTLQLLRAAQRRGRRVRHLWVVT